MNDLPPVPWRHPLDCGHHTDKDRQLERGTGTFCDTCGKMATVTADGRPVLADDGVPGAG